MTRAHRLSTVAASSLMVCRAGPSRIWRRTSQPSGGAETDPAVTDCRANGALEGHRRQVTALVDHDRPVASEDLGHVALAGQGLEDEEVDDLALARPRSEPAEDSAGP